MKLYLHIGTGRTGTQSLQQYMKRNSDTLRRNGVFYPLLDGKDHHNALALPVCGSKPPRYLRARFGDDYQKNITSFHDYADKLAAEVRQATPETLVLSSEFLGRAFAPDMGQILFDRLRQFSSDITVLVYLRNPADYYLSATLQTLKASGLLKHPRKQGSRAILKSYAPLGATIRVREYNRKILLNGDVRDDFINGIDPDLVGALPIRPAERNETLSAEVMEIIQDYRNAYWANANNQFNEETNTLLDTLREAAQAESLYRKPQLRRDVAASLIALDEDMVWLDRTFGFRFSDVDYDTTPVGLAPLDGAYRRVRDICDIDETLKERIALAGLASYATRKSEPAQTASSGHAETQPAPNATGPTPISQQELDRIREVSTRLRLPEAEVWAAPRNFKQLQKTNEAVIRRNFPLLQLDEIKDWSIDPGHGVVWRLYFNSFGWAAVLGDIDTAGHPQTPDWDRAARFVIMFLDYAKQHGDDEKSDIWDDHATGYRASFLAWLYARGLAEHLTPQETKRLHKMMLRHREVLMRFLASDKWKFSNHTLFQAEGLADLALVFLRNRERREATLDVAREAVRAFMDRAVTHAEGTVKEHALFYHVFLMGRLQDTFRYFESIGYPVSGIDSATFARMNEFLHDAMPSPGRLPGIGDSKHFQRFDKKYVVAFEEEELQTDRVRYHRSNGTEGEAWPFLAQYPTDGYYIMRSHSALNAQLYSMLLDRPFRGPHGHWDGGSFVLYSQGQPVLIDCGGPYRYSNPMRYQYFTTQLAHNVVIFDNDPRQIATRRLDLYSGKETAIVAIGASMGHGQAWLRLFGQFANKAAFTLDIASAADQASTAEARFHVEPTCKLEIENGKGTISGDCGKVDVRSRSISLDQIAGQSVRDALCSPDTGVPKSQFVEIKNRKKMRLDEDFDRRSFVTYKDGTMEEGQLFFIPAPLDHATLTVFDVAPDESTIEVTCSGTKIFLQLPEQTSRITFDLSRMTFT